MIRKEASYIFKTVPYGYLSEEELHIGTELKNKMLDVLREHLQSLKAELERI